MLKNNFVSFFASPCPTQTKEREKKKNDLVNHFGNHDIISWLPFSYATFEISCSG